MSLHHLPSSNRSPETDCLLHYRVQQKQLLQFPRKFFTFHFNNSCKHTYELFCDYVWENYQQDSPRYLTWIKLCEFQLYKAQCSLAQDLILQKCHLKINCHQICHVYNKSTNLVGYNTGTPSTLHAKLDNTQELFASDLDWPLMRVNCQVNVAIGPSSKTLSICVHLKINHISKFKLLYLLIQNILTKFTANSPIPKWPTRMQENFFKFHYDQYQNIVCQENYFILPHAPL